MILLALALGLGAAGENRLWWGEVALRGPVEAAVVRHDDGASALARAVPAGTERTVRVPLGARVPGDEPARLPRELDATEVSGSGAARFAGWLEPQPASAWKSVTPGLRARGLPPVADGGARPSAADLAIVLAACALGFGLRGRDGARFLVGAVAGGVLWFLPGAEAEPVVEVYEGEGTDSWVVVTRATDRLALRGSELRLEVDPPRRPVDFRREAGGSPASEGRWVGSSPRTRLTSWSVPVAVELSRDANRFRSLAACWLRDPAGGWRALGRWELGRGLPGEAGGEPGEAPPPGWAASGLPPGRAVLLGRAEGVGTDRETWIRWVGFP